MIECLAITKPARVRVKLFDFQKVSNTYPSRSLPISAPNEYKNLICDSGALSLSYGLADIMSAKALPFPVNDTANVSMVFYKGKSGNKDLLVAYNTIHGSFVMDMGLSADYENVCWKRLSTFPYEQAEEFRVNGENILIFSDGKDLAKFDGENFTYLANAAPISAQTACNHFGRLFLGGRLNPYALHFSDELDPLNFTVSAFEGGYINLDIDYGGLIKLVSMNEYLYLIMQRGIMRLRAYGDQSEFQLKKLDVFTGDIIASSVAKCGGKIVFASSAGLMVFDGYSCNVVHEEIKDKLAGDLRIKPFDIHACYCYNSYFLSYWNSKGTTEILAIDLNKNNYSYVSCDLTIGMTRIDREGEQLLMYNTYKSSMAEIQPLQILEQSGAEKGVIKCIGIDFDEPSKTKVIKSMEIPDGFRGCITLNNHTTIKKVVLTNKKFVDINLSGKIFDITIEMTGRQPNYSPIVSVETARGN